MPFITHQDELWVSLLSEVKYDLYHLPEFTSLEAELLHGIALAWYHEKGSNKVLIPLVKRKIANQPVYDLQSPYGYPGMISSEALNTNEARKIFSCFHQEAKQEGYVSSFIRLNPLNNSWHFNTNRTNDDTPVFRQWFHGGTISVDLTGKPSSIRAAFSLNHKRNIKRLVSLGFEVQINHFEFLEAFRLAYRQTMKRREANPYYFFPDSYFEHLKQLCNEKLIFISITDSDGNFVSGGLFTFFHEIIQYHLGATINTCVQLSPSKLMVDAAIDFGL